MKRFFPFYTAIILISTPALWCLSIGFAHGLCNLILIGIGSPRPFDTPIRAVSLGMAAGSPLIIWPVAGAVFGADLFRWRFSAPSDN